MQGLPLNLENAIAWHANRKTQHRVLMEPQPTNTEGMEDKSLLERCEFEHICKMVCPYKVGEEVFIAEPWSFDGNGEPMYQADYSCWEDYDWNPPSAMLQMTSRYTAIITDIRVERDDEGWVWVYELKKG